MPAPRSLRALFVLGLAAFAARPAAAQHFTGTFTVPNQVGGTMTLSLVEAGGGVSGSLSSNGVTYQVQGQIQDGTLVGVMSGADGALYFAAERWENELWVELYGTDANGQPDYDDFTEIDFVLAEGSARAAQHIGREAGEYVVAAKKQELPAHMPWKTVC